MQCVNVKHLDHGSFARTLQWPSARIIHTTTTADASTIEKMKSSNILKRITNKLKFIDFEGAVSYNSLINFNIFKFL